MNVISLELAKDHLRITHTAEDSLLERYIRQVEQAIFEYIGFDDLEDFYYEHGESFYGQLESAILLGLYELYYNRGSSPITQSVKDLLRRLRNPVLS